MPGYEPDLNARQLEDLVAYVLAVSGWQAELPDHAYEGRKLALRRGCIGCHGPSGMGGVANPGSLKGLIPAWTGPDFAALVRDERELRNWILAGRIERLWNSPTARLFLDRQKTPMPAYQGHVSAAELELLVAYIQWLRAGAAGKGHESREASTVIGFAVEQRVGLSRARGRAAVRNPRRPSAAVPGLHPGRSATGGRQRPVPRRGDHRRGVRTDAGDAFAGTRRPIAARALYPR